MYLKNYHRLLLAMSVMLLATFTLNTLPASAATPHTAYGTHGMALFSIQGKWYASHMPLANSIHAHQIIMQVKIDGINPAALEGHSLISFAPKKFDLHALQSGEVKAAQGKLYVGHFERDGTVLPNNITLTFEDILLNEPITAVNNGSYWRVRIAPNYELLVHQISSARSYDQLLLVEVPVGQQGDIKLNVNLPANQKDLQPWLTKNKGTFLKQLYLETQDFK